MAAAVPAVAAAVPAVAAVVHKVTEEVAMISVTAVPLVAVAVTLQVAVASLQWGSLRRSLPQVLAVASATPAVAAVAMLLVILRAATLLPKQFFQDLRQMAMMRLCSTRLETVMRAAANRQRRLGARGWLR